MDQEVGPDQVSVSCKIELCWEDAEQVVCTLIVPSQSSACGSECRRHCCFLLQKQVPILWLTQTRAYTSTASSTTVFEGSLFTRIDSRLISFSGIQFTPLNRFSDMDSLVVSGRGLVAAIGMQSFTLLELRC